MRALTVAFALAACGHPAPSSTAPASGAPAIDRFSDAAGHLMLRRANAALPAADAPLDLDHAPFLTQGLGPDGGVVRYVNFDVQPAAPAIRYRLVRAGTHEPIAADQPDLIDALPGDPGYSDFAQLAWVDAPAELAPGSITSAAEIRARGLVVALDPHAIDCPIVPRGTRAPTALGVAAAAPEELVYRGARVTCLRFGEPLALDGDGHVPTSPIYVTFAHEHVFQTEGATPQTHNVVFSVPGDLDYSPLWAVHIYDRAAFDQVKNAESAARAPGVTDGPLVNCPIVALEAP